MLNSTKGTMPGCNESDACQEQSISFHLVGSFVATQYHLPALKVGNQRSNQINPTLLQKKQLLAVLHVLHKNQQNTKTSSVPPSTLSHPITTSDATNVICNTVS